MVKQSRRWRVTLMTALILCVIGAQAAAQEPEALDERCVWGEVRLGVLQGGELMGGLRGGVDRWSGRWGARVGAGVEYRRRASAGHYGHREGGARLMVGGLGQVGDDWTVDAELGAEAVLKRWSPDQGVATTRVHLQGPAVSMGLNHGVRKGWSIRGAVDGWRRRASDGEWGYRQWEWGAWMGMVRHF